MGEIIEHLGRRFSVEIVPEDNWRTPWEEEDGHGPVSDWRRRNYAGHYDKAPGEMLLHEDRGSARFYDFAEACRIARAEGWDAAPYTPCTPRQKAARAALADFERLRRWCAGDWCYVGVVVSPVCECCETPDDRYTESLWGINSDAGDYLDTVALELAEMVIDALETEAA